MAEAKSQAVPQASSKLRATVLVLVLGATVAGFAGGWFARGVSASSVEGYQRGVFSLDPGEELKVFYPEAYASPPRLELNARPNVKIVEERPNYFKVRIEPGTQVVNARWEAWGSSLK